MTVAESAVKKRLADFVGTVAPFDLAEADGLTPYIKRQICVFGKCGDNCPYLKQCRYMKYLKLANDPKIDFQITNHNYFLADTLRRAGGERSLLPNYQMVIIDEAHKFLASARSMYGMELTNGEITSLAKSVHHLEIGKSNSGLNIHKLAQKLNGQGKRLFRRLNESIPTGADDEANRFIAVIDTKNARHLKNIIAIAEKLSVALNDSHVTKRFASLIPSVIRRLTYINEKAAALKQHERLIYWLEKSDEPETDECQSVRLDTLFAIPKDLDSRLYRDLWSGGAPIVLTSGTLSASGDFSRVKETLGLQHLPERRLFSASMPSPFDYKNNAFIYISESVPFPDNKDKRYIISVADEIERLVIAAHGHAAVLFTSYNAMGQVHAILSKRNLSFPLFRLERGGTLGIEQFKRSGNGILLASGALWEGIDIPGDALSLLIIIKLPFAVPDPIGNYEKSLYGSMEIYKTLCVMPDMLVKNKQGFGRAIRTECDTAVIAMLDCRLREGAPYRGVLFASLPPCRVTSRIGDVKKFIEEKKSADYFSACP
jgi:ATP-dependent DNA helicase DinG